jgi:hypothetical protein
MQGYDEWLTHDTRREIQEACEEGKHKFHHRNGCCIHCGEEDENFDPDTKRDREEDGWPADADMVIPHEE